MPLFIKSVGTVTAYVHGLSEFTNRWMRQHCHLQAQFCYNFTTAKEYSSYGYIFITIYGARFQLRCRNYNITHCCFFLQVVIRRNHMAKSAV